MTASVRKASSEISSEETQTSERLVEEISFYRKYHYNPVNVAIHILCIPLILLSSIYILTWLRVPETFLPSQVRPFAPYMNAGSLLAVSFGCYYILLDPSLGSPAAFGLIVTATKFTTWSTPAGKQGYVTAWAVWTICWIAQFIGHAVFERRAPALFNNLQQALILAPYFALLEIVHMLGFRRDVMDKVDKRVLPEIQAFQQRLSTASKSSNTSG